MTFLLSISLATRSTTSFLVRSLRSFSSLEDSLGGTVTIFRTATPSTDIADASQFDKSPNVELQIRQQFTSPPGGVDPRIDSTGRIVWPTAMSLLERIQRDFLNSRSKTDEPLQILELGSGCGLLGMGLAATGLANVVLTDHTDAIEWLCSNVELNRNVVGDHASVAALAWGNEEHATNLETRHTRPFDLIVGSDIVYNQHVHTELTQTMKRFASPANAPIYIAYPKRKDEDPFLSIAQELFHIKVESLRTVATVAENSLAILSCKET